MLGIVVFVYGLVIGSFLGVCICRIPKGESVMFPASHCTNCNKEIKWYDLIPIVSFLLLKGKCRHCGVTIGSRSLVIEVLTGVFTYVLYLKFGLTFELVKFAMLLYVLIVIGFIDYDTMDVYFKTSVVGVVLGVIFLIVGAFLGQQESLSFLGYQGFLGYSIFDFILGGVLGGGIILLIVLVTHSMGWGDVEVFFIGGLFLGWQLTLVAMLGSFILAGVICAILLATKKVSRKDYIPFVPFITMAIMIAVFVGDWIVQWYANLI